MTFKKGNHPKTEWEKGKTPWNKGKKTGRQSEETKTKRSNSMKGKNKGRKYTVKSKMKMSGSAKLRKIHGMFGKKQSEDSKNKISKKLIGRKLSNEDKKNKRIAKIKYIQNKINMGEPIFPTIGKNETEILNKLEEIFNYTIIRQYYIKGLGYWVDGYIPELNLCIEVDEEYHKKRKEKDIQRQKEIEEKLICKFLRIKDNLEGGKK